jgi:hypothetical protein
MLIQTNTSAEQFGPVSKLSHGFSCGLRVAIQKSINKQKRILGRSNLAATAVNLTRGYQIGAGRIAPLPEFLNEQV